MKKAVVLLSGGLDSSTILALAISQGFRCYALSFDYGQKQVSELTASQHIAAHFGVLEHKIIRLHDVGALGGSALTDPHIAVPSHLSGQVIPVTYVPARNTVFLSIALGWAEGLKASDIFIGVSAVDYSNYPDCRPAYIQAFQSLADLATKEAVEAQHFIKINTPLIHLSKAQTIQMGLSLGVDYAQTVTCYVADERGQACGLCDACVLRKKGFSEAGVPDPTLYRS